MCHEFRKILLISGSKYAESNKFWHCLKSPDLPLLSLQFKLYHAVLRDIVDVIVSHCRVHFFLCKSLLLLVLKDIGSTAHLLWNFGTCPSNGLLLASTPTQKNQSVPFLSLLPPPSCEIWLKFINDHPVQRRDQNELWGVLWCSDHRSSRST